MMRSGDWTDEDEIADIREELEAIKANPPKLDDWVCDFGAKMLQIAELQMRLAELLLQPPTPEAGLKALAAAVLDPRMGQQPVSVYRARAERLARAVDEFLCQSKA